MDESTNPERPIGAPAATAVQPAAPEVDADELRRLVIGAVSEVYDPEIPVNIYELGLVYSVEVTADGNVAIVMTLTSPMCPVAETLPLDVEMRVRGIDGVNDVAVEITWDPPWNPEMMSEAAKLELGFM